MAKKINDTVISEYQSMLPLSDELLEDEGSNAGNQSDSEASSGKEIAGKESAGKETAGKEPACKGTACKEAACKETAGASHLDSAKRVEAMAVPMLDWFDRNKRDLPWRQDPTPYHVWISEIMLQQTRVEAVIPYYNRFLQALPDLGDLARVDDDRLMKLWQGLGYYSRARNLKKAAMEAVENFEGSLPADHKKLLGLPGIGPYTAGAIASIAFGLKVPAVDGNVLRVIARLCGDDTPIDSPNFKKMTDSLLAAHMPSDRPGDFNQALMEIGALVCIPNGAPLCDRCPLAGICEAKIKNLTDRIPVKLPKKKRRLEDMTVFLISQADDWADEVYDRDDFGFNKDLKPLNAPAYLIRKRPEEGLLAGLYEFPHESGHLNDDECIKVLIEKYLGENASFAVEKMEDAKHVFSHVEWRMIAYRVHLCSKYEAQGQEMKDPETQGPDSMREKTQGPGMRGTNSMEVKSQGQEPLDPDFKEQEVRMIPGREILDSYAIPSAFAPFVERIREEVTAYEN